MFVRDEEDDEDATKQHPKNKRGRDKLQKEAGKRLDGTFLYHYKDDDDDGLEYHTCMHV